MLTTLEASQRLRNSGLSTYTAALISTLAREGAFQNAYKDESGKWRIPESDIDSFIAILKKQKKNRVKILLASLGSLFAVLVAVAALTSGFKDGLDLVKDFRSGFNPPIPSDSPPLLTGFKPSSRGVYTKEIYAKISWQQTKLVISHGQTVQIIASGSIFLAEGNLNTEHSPDGCHKNIGRCSTDFCEEARCSGRDLPFGSLIARVGIGEPFVIGYGKVFKAEDEGELWLAINDNAHGDNSGAFAVIIEIK